MTMNSKIPAPVMVIYDWDNTLVDTWPVIHAAMNRLFQYMEMPEWTLEETKSRVKLSMRDSFPILFQDRWEEARDVFYQAFEEVHLKELSAATGAVDLLGHLHATRIPQSVVSNKQGKYLRVEATQLEWAHFFDTLIGAGDMTRDKPAPDAIEAILSKAGLAAGPEIYFLGDSSVDMEIAHATGLTPVLIHPDPDLEKSFAQHPPQKVFSSLPEFQRFVMENQ